MNFHISAEMLLSSSRRIRNVKMRQVTKRRFWMAVCTMTMLFLVYSTHSKLFSRRLKTYGYSEMLELYRIKSGKDRSFQVPKAPDETEEFYDSFINIPVPSWYDLNSRFDHVRKGGRSKPVKTSHKIVLIVPYRDRPVHLKLFLNHMHSFLKRQNLEYVIYVVEMGPEDLFNRGSLSNAGFLEVIKREKTPCVIFHDVDMLPTNNDNLYFCSNSVRHYAHAVEQYTFKLLYQTYVGGVIAFPPGLFHKINGYSNLYSGWGGEDDDLYIRIVANNVTWMRQSAELGRYSSWSHKREPELINRDLYGMTSKVRMKIDGLNSIQYMVDVVEERPLFTWILVKLTLANDSLTHIEPKFLLNKRDLLLPDENPHNT